MDEPNDNTTNNIQNHRDEHLPIRSVDVLYGKGKEIFNHPGNSRFREIVWSHVEEYLNCNNSHERLRLAEKVIDAIETKCGGRFLRKNHVNNSWILMNDRQIHDKILNAFRDTTKNLPTSMLLSSSRSGAEANRTKRVKRTTTPRRGTINITTTKVSDLNNSITKVAVDGGALKSPPLLFPSSQEQQEQQRMGLVVDATQPRGLSFARGSELLSTNQQNEIHRSRISRSNNIKSRGQKKEVSTTMLQHDRNLLPSVQVDTTPAPVLYVPSIATLARRNNLPIMAATTAQPSLYCTTDTTIPPENITPNFCDFISIMDAKTFQQNLLLQSIQQLIIIPGTMALQPMMQHLEQQEDKYDKLLPGRYYHSTDH